MAGALIDAVWHCEACGVEGTLEVLPHVPYTAVFELMVVAHEEMAADCTDRALVGMIKQR